MLQVVKDGQVNALLTKLYGSDIGVPMQELITYLKVSRRTGFTVMKRANVALTDLNLEEVQNVKGKGYYLTEATKQELQVYDQQAAGTPVVSGITKQLRVPLLGLFLLIKGRPLTSLADTFGITVNTLLTDLKSLSDRLIPYKLVVAHDDIKHHYIDGEPSNKVSLLWELLNNYLGDDYYRDVVIKLIGQDRLDESNTLLQMFEQTNGKYYSDDSFLQNNILLTLVKTLVANGQLAVMNSNNTSALDPSDQIYSSVEFDWLQETYFVGEYKLPANILIKLSKYLMGSSYHSLTVDELPTFIQTDTVKVMHRFEKVTNVKLDEPELFKKRLAVHLTSTYWWDYYNLNYVNPTVEAIKKHYADVLELTRFAIVPFEDELKHPLSLDELALIATYLGGELRNHRSPVKEVPIVLLVCSSGIGTSLLLKRQLEERYTDSNFLNPISLQQLDGYDLSKVTNIVTTTNVPGKVVTQMHNPVLKVHAIPTQHEWKELDKQFNLVQRGATVQSVNTLIDIISNYARIEDFEGLTEALTTFMTPHDYNHATLPKTLKELLIDHIQMIDTAGLDWESALRLAGKPLIKEDVIAPEYLDKIATLTKTLGTYMVISDEIMLAHAKPEDGVNALGMSLLINQQPMTIGNKHVKWIILLATPDDKQHLGALEQLLQLLQLPNILDTDNQDDLVQKLNTL